MTRGGVTLDLDAGGEITSLTTSRPTRAEGVEKVRAVLSRAKRRATGAIIALGLGPTLVIANPRPGSVKTAGAR